MIAGEQQITPGVHGIIAARRERIACERRILACERCPDRRQRRPHGCGRCRRRAPRQSHTQPLGHGSILLVRMVPAAHTRTRIDRARARGKDVRPCPLPWGAWVLPRKRVGGDRPRRTRLPDPTRGALDPDEMCEDAYDLLVARIDRAAAPAFSPTRCLRAKAEVPQAPPCTRTGSPSWPGSASRPTRVSPPRGEVGQERLDLRRPPCRGGVACCVQSVASNRCRSCSVRML